MSDRSHIGIADYTQNPIRGCAIASRGCENCSSLRNAVRMTGPNQPYEGLVEMTPNGPAWTGTIRLAPEKITEPLTLSRPRKVLVNSVGDVFHSRITDEYLLLMLQAIHDGTSLGGAGDGKIMRDNRRGHIFQIQTKRAGRMQDFMSRLRLDGNRLVLSTDAGLPLYGPLNDQVWVGISAEDQKTADERLKILASTPTAMPWASFEPLLEQIDLNGHLGLPTSIRWGVVSGESGPRARQIRASWVRRLRDQLVGAGIPFFFNGWGAWTPFDAPDDVPLSAQRKSDMMSRSGAGDVLDGRRWKEFPAVSAWAEVN